MSTDVFYRGNLNLYLMLLINISNILFIFKLEYPRG